MDENTENKKTVYRRSMRHTKKNFHTIASKAEEDDSREYDENYRFDREKLSRSYRRSNLGKEDDFEEDYSEDGDKYGKYDSYEEEESPAFVRSSFFANSFSHLQLLILSVLLSLSFYSFPLFNRVATGSAAVSLYSGFAMNHGVTPYNEFFGSSGPLFYFVNQIGAATGSTLILWLCEVIALWASGIAAFDILQEMLRNKVLSTVIGAAAILAIAGISMGGDQAIIFALPFAFYGVRVLNRYFMDDEAVRDEVFILFGIAGALASLFFPLFLVIWLLGFLGLFGRNIALRNFGRGFYQLLCGLFGFLLVFSLAGYYTLTTQIFYPTIEQAVIIPFTHLNLSVSGAIHLAISLGLILLFGLLASWFNGFYYVANGNHRVWTFVLLIAGMLSLVVVSFMQGYSPAYALVILPFAFMYAGLLLDREAFSGQNDRQRTLGQTFSKYLRATAFLPVLGLIFLLVFPIANNMYHSSYISSEKSVAAYVKKNSAASDQVTVLADSLEINRLSKRSSDVTMPPSYYPASYSKALSVNISTSSSKLIVVDDAVKIPDSLKVVLDSKYAAVKFNNSHFKIYQLK
ncbi:hypothetical protein [Lactovum odontotermitis]